MTEAAGAGLERLELRIERLRLTFRFTFAFHAREVRFECDRGAGFERVFPETFSFHVDRHDPTELYLQLSDLLSKPQLISPRANRRESGELVRRLLAASPAYLESVCDRLEGEDRLDSDARLRMYLDVGLLSQVMLRFQETQELNRRRSMRVAGFHLTKLLFRSMSELLEGRVDPEYVARYVRGEVDPIDRSDDPTEGGLLAVYETGEPEVVNRMLMRMSERAFYLWLEGVCLDTDNQAFEKEDSPFRSRESEILDTIRVAERPADSRIERGENLRPFLRRSSRDCKRVLGRLEHWFLRNYDIIHSSALIQHRAMLENGEEDGRRRLTWHLPHNYVLALAALASPFVLGAFAYERAPVLVDAFCSLAVISVNVAVIWFLLYQFCWKRDLTMFHASVPRIGAGIIVGYLPVFLIDEVWGLADRDAFTLGFVAILLGLTTLLYIYVEVQSRLSDKRAAFARARAIFLLGMVEAAVLGVLLTSVVGRYMVTRNWSPDASQLPIESLRVSLEPVVGQLPRIVGFEPFYAFPSAVLMMTFLSFFIGIFLQLMWEELPLTEPL